jgi:Pentapeptide repeats (8 copies)
MSQPHPVPTASEHQNELQAVAQQAAQDVVDQQRPSFWARLAGALPLVATLVTVLITLLSTLQSQSQYRESQANERFQTAVTMLAAGDLSTRLGGIYTLMQVAQSYPARENASSRILAAYLRSRFPNTAQSRALPLTGLPASEEINVVAEALAARSDHTNHLDLGRISARGLTARGLDLRGVIFPDADLSGAAFGGAHLTGTLFMRAILTGADFRGATLSGANMTGATLNGTDFRGTDLSGVTGLSAAQLARARTDRTTVRPSGLK